mgnify:CR=1 FL=1
MTTSGGGLCSGASWDDSDELIRVAGLLDQIAAEVSPLRRFTLARSLILDPFREGGADSPATGLQDLTVCGGDLDEPWDHPWDDAQDRATSRLPLLESAAWAAMRYQVEFTIDGRKERARLEPHFKGPDSTDPLDTDVQSKDLVDVWRALAKLVTAPGARAALSHLVFQSAGGREHAQVAAAAYIELSMAERRAADMVLSARVAVRLARAVGDTALGARAIEALERIAECCVLASAVHG